MAVKRRNSTQFVSYILVIWGIFLQRLNKVFLYIKKCEHQKKRPHKIPPGI